MKSIFKIFRSYILSACGVALSILLVNFIGYMVLVFYFNQNYGGMESIGQIASQLQMDKAGMSLSSEGEELMKQWEWGMVLDEEGKIIWKEKLPDDLNKQYSLSDVAGFSRWYLKDYPVSVYRSDHGLLVLGRKAGSEWKGMLTFPTSFIKLVISHIWLFFVVNIGVIILLSMLFGIRFYKQLKELAAGIENLTNDEPVLIPEKGTRKELAICLNKTARKLQSQKELIEKRDNARTSWVAGVSHDIRTPLSMIMGYSEQLSNADNLEEKQKEKAEMIKEQSIKIKSLIQDLNLISRLEYNSQPLRIEECHPGIMLRKIVTDIYNNEVTEDEILLSVTKEAEESVMMADKNLMMRVFENLISNSIRHNEEGCHIEIDVRHISEDKKRYLRFSFKDDGKGIPESILKKMEKPEMLDNEGPHIMGLYVVWQIVNSHKGTIEFGKNHPKGTIVNILIPVNM